jgi:hypothetical protein
MTRATLIRVLLAMAVAIATGIDQGRAQTNCDGPCPAGPSIPPPARSNDNTGWWVVGVLVAGILGLAIIKHNLPDPPPRLRLRPRRRRDRR